ncbi:hypothetical protein Ccrd_020955 [Cynara cardunculus var. scolymus]|uniref:RNase H type-1 domain-containing protein n=1 Tax=Cynara cardunculus var. scolymus TaxID=59895 RepID=A0A103Y1H2_CYNCS|nr:hypothetical protein Ccrd_020955 [Cynara cardunculus var. scolymus]
MQTRSGSGKQTSPTRLGAPTTSFWIGMSLEGPNSRTKCLLSPRRDFLKCNIDAATSENSNSAGFDAILRDSRGTFISTKATPNTSLPPVCECEAYSLRDAILWVQGRGLFNVIFETEAKIVVDAIYDKSHDISEFGDIIFDI